jgi:hypothetical protein
MSFQDTTVRPRSFRKQHLERHYLWRYAYISSFFCLVLYKDGGVEAERRREDNAKEAAKTSEVQ